MIETGVESVAPDIEKSVAPDVGKNESEPVSLEAAELELVLQMQNIVEKGFVGALRGALAELGGTLLFDLPESHLEGFQRVAAVTTGSGEDRKIFLVHLDHNGSGTRVEEAISDTTTIAGFAASYADLMDRLAA